MSFDNSSNKTQDFDDDFLEWEERDDSVPYLVHCIGIFSNILEQTNSILAGSIAGITEHVSMLPFDTIKVNYFLLIKTQILDSYASL